MSNRPGRATGSPGREPRRSAKAGRPVTTHCPYCSLNCGLELRVEGGGETGGRSRVVGQSRWKGAPLTGGALCSKGATAWEQIHHAERLTSPLVRDRAGGELRPASWDEALDRAAGGFRDLRAGHGPAANAVLSGGSLTNEKAYLMGKFARLALGTPHIDLNGRMCMTAAGAANMRAFGLDRAMTPFDELADAQVVMVVGANLSASFPVKVPKLLDACRQAGGRVILVDPRAGRFLKPGDLHLALRPGSDAALAGGLLREVVRNGWVDRDFVARRTTGFEAAVAAAEPWDPAAVEATTGVPAAQVVEAAEVVGRAGRGMYLHARGAEQQTAGTMNVLSLINLALARGHVGRRGCGINMLTGQRNGQGGREMGQRCDQLPGARHISDPEHRRQVARVWGVPEADLPGQGLTYVEVLESARRGEIRGLLSISTNPAVSAPDLTWAEQALDRLDHLVVVDPFLSETCRFADVVLPGTTFGEEEGTVTTIEGRAIRVDQATSPVPGRSDIDVVRNLANRLGARRHFTFVRGREVFEELRVVTQGAPADYSGMTWEGIRERGGIFWPCPQEGHPGTPRLYAERFAHPDGLARFHPVHVDPPPHVAGGRFPLVLTTGRVLPHYLSGNQTRRIAAQAAKAPEPVAEVHPETAAGLGLGGDDRLRLTSRQGSVEVAWTPHDGLRRDTVYLPYHWPVANRLTDRSLDPISKIPGLKYTPVHAEAVSPDPPDGSPLPGEEAPPEQPERGATGVPMPARSGR